MADDATIEAYIARTLVAEAEARRLRREVEYWRENHADAVRRKRAKDTVIWELMAENNRLREAR